MHVRLSMVLGTYVVEDQADTVLGRLSDIVLNPDTGVVVGFFVRGPGLFSSPLFLSVMDIVAWGTVVHVRDEHRLCPPEDLVRLRSILADPRKVLSQRMETKKHVYLGVCQDIQFDTRQFVMEWLFPRKWLFFTGIPVAASDILEVTPKAIIIREKTSAVPEKEKAEPAEEVRLPDVIPATTSASKKL